MRTHAREDHLLNLARKAADELQQCANAVLRDYERLHKEFRRNIEAFNNWFNPLTLFDEPTPEIAELPAEAVILGAARLQPAD